MREYGWSAGIVGALHCVLNLRPPLFAAPSIVSPSASPSWLGPLEFESNALYLRFQIATSQLVSMNDHECANVFERTSLICLCQPESGSNVSSPTG